MQNALPGEKTHNSKKAIASVLMKRKKISGEEDSFAPTIKTRNVTKFTIYLEGIVGVFRLSHCEEVFKCINKRS